MILENPFEGLSDWEKIDFHYYGIGFHMITTIQTLDIWAWRSCRVDLQKEDTILVTYPRGRASSFDNQKTYDENCWH